MNNTENKNKIAIVVVGYNRLDSLSRLLASLTEASYPSKDIPLVISIDASGNEDLYNFVREYEWIHGVKYVRIQEKRLGLREHIYSCGDLTHFFKGIILLEDDLLVSPFFYDYTVAALNYYDSDPKAAGIGLYSYRSNIFTALPFEAYQDQYDVYGTKATITWGQAWNARMWNEFRQWLLDNSNINWDAIDMIQTIKDFKRAWSKYFSAYMAVTDKYMITPYKSYTTNFSDAGEHNTKTLPIAQVPMVRRKENLILASVEKLVRYDSYFDPEDIFDILPVPSDEVYIDLYGNRKNILGKRYLVSIDILPYKIVKSYALSMRPIDANLRLNTPGRGIYLYDLQIEEKRKTEIQPISSIEYRLIMFRPHLLLKYIIHNILIKIKRKFHV